MGLTRSAMLIRAKKKSLMSFFVYMYSYTCFTKIHLSNLHHTISPKRIFWKFPQAPTTVQCPTKIHTESNLVG